jgi:hypothetical protein
MKDSVSTLPCAVRRRFYKRIHTTSRPNYAQNCIRQNSTKTFHRRRTQITIKTPNPKCQLFLKCTSKGTWRRQVFIGLRPRSPPPTPVTHWMNTDPCTYSHRDGGGRGVRWTSEKVRGALVHKRGQKYQHDWLGLQSINSIKHQKRRHLGFGVFIVIWSMVCNEDATGRVWCTAAAPL